MKPRRLLPLAGITALAALVATAQAAPGKQLRLVGSVTAEAAPDGLLVKGNPALQCKYRDERSGAVTDATCDTVNTHLLARTVALAPWQPGPPATGSREGGFRSAWADWGVMATWDGAVLAGIQTDAQGIATVQVATTWLEGCATADVTQCASPHGNAKLPVARMALAALEASVPAWESASLPAACLKEGAEALDRCVQVGELVRLAECGKLGGAVDATTCEAVRARALAADGKRIASAAKPVVTAYAKENVPPDALVTLLAEPEAPRLAVADQQALRKDLVVGLGKRFDTAQGDAVDGVRDLLPALEKLDGTSAATKARVQRLAAWDAALAKKAAAAAAARATREKSCVQGCMTTIVSCSSNSPMLCGGRCGHSSLCPCCHPAEVECESGGTVRLAYNTTHAACQ